MNINENVIKEKIEEITEKIKADDDLLEKFKADPIKTIEGLIGIDLPDEAIEKLVEGIKAKITLDKASDLIGGIGKLFGRK